MRPGTEESVLNTPPTAADAAAPPRPTPRGRGALYTATVLAPLAAVALFAVWRSGRLPPLWPVRQAAAQQPPAADAGQPPLSPAAPAAADAIAGGALKVLIEQAKYWRARQRDDQAILSLNRALALAPDNADALVLLAQAEAEQGDQRGAAAALDRLRQVAPGDPRIAGIAQAIHVGAIAPDDLAEARRLARSGRQAEAIERYDRIFKGDPPPDSLAIEYYQTLAGVEGGYDRAREGLARLVRQNAQDLRAQLGYAQVLTYRDTGRLEGIERLATLAQNPAVAEQATEAWRHALGWLPGTKDSIAPLQAFLATHPGDADIAAELERAKNPLIGASVPARARIDGFEALNHGKLSDAERLFQQAIDADNNDADATGGLGIVRLRQHNFAEAKTLLARAIALDLEHKSRWLPALAAASNPGGGPNPAVALIRRGDYASAARELNRQSARGGDLTGLQAMLADAEARSGRLQDAEATYRVALGRSPNNAQVLLGLAGVLSREGRGQDAAPLLDRAQAAGGDTRGFGQARAQQLREQANAATDPATRLGLYRAAVAADPASPWVRLDLARALLKLGQTSEAHDTMAAATGASATPDGLKAGIIFANESADPDTAAALIARLPPGLRTPDMRAQQLQASLQRELNTTLLLSRPMARQRLLAMATVADPDGARGAALARALGSIGDTFGAREAVVAAQASTPRQGAAARLRYADALMAIGDSQGAADMLAQVGSPRALDGDDRQRFTQLRAGLAVRTSDKLNEQGRQADAYDHLAPLLAQAPDNTDLNLALARLYQGARNPAEALQISQAMLRRDPNNVEARKGAVAAALQLGDRRLAETLVEDGEQLRPNDPGTWMMAADVAKARGDNGRALRDLERARALRLQQLGYAGSDTGADSAPPAVNLAPGDMPSFRPVLPRPAAAPLLLPNADGGADQPVDLTPPPLPPPTTQSAAPPDPPPPFTPQPMNAVGELPTYQPATVQAADSAPAAVPPRTAASAPLPVPADNADQMNAQELGREQAVDAALQSQVPVPVMQAPGSEPPADDQPPARAPQRPPPPYRAAQAALYRPDDAEPPTVSRGALQDPTRPAPPFDVSQDYYANPFRPGADDALAGATPPAAAADPMTEQIDRDILALRDTVAPSAQAGFGFRTRSGSSGLDQLTELTVPMEATFSPGGYGQLKLAVTPTFLNAGSLGGYITNQQRFGSNALALRSNATTGVTTLSGTAPGDQTAAGAGFDLGYSVRGVSADIGTSPAGFREQNILGGVEWAPQLSDHVRLRLLAERRAVNDSILSFAGTTDPRTGEKWGGVVRDHGRATLEFSAGRADFYLLGGGATFTGTHVQSNTEIEAGAGGGFPVYRTPTQEVRLGLDLIYFGYSHNQDFFTLGQGGYFSPQSFAAALIPITWKEKLDEDLSYEVGASGGFATFRESASPYYPIDPALQADLIAQQASAATAVPGVLAEFPAMTQSGFSGTAHASVDYRVSPSLHLGGRVSFETSPAYNQTMAMAYAKYLFNGEDK
jgi:predicted Zn-dependent protease